MDTAWRSHHIRCICLGEYRFALQPNERSRLLDSPSDIRGLGNGDRRWAAKHAGSIDPSVLQVGIYVYRVARALIAHELCDMPSNNSRNERIDPCPSRAGS